MADQILVTQSNLDVLLKGLKSRFLVSYNNITVFSNASVKISILDIIKTNGTGTNVLANDSTYKSMQTSNIIDVYTRSNSVYTLLNIKAYNSTYIPDIPVYQNIVNKLTPIITNGNGDKLLNDMGVYVDVTLYRGLTTIELTNLTNDIIGGI